MAWENEIGIRTDSKNTVPRHVVAAIAQSFRHGKVLW